MADDMHEVVKLLLARMESHPDEFVENTGRDSVISDGIGDRWWRVLTFVEDYGTDEEQKAIGAGLRKIKLNRAHEIMMDELCNGEERRRKERENILNTAHNNMGASLRAAISPALQKIDMEMQQQQLEAYKSTYVTYDAENDTYQLGNGLTLTRAEIQENPGFVATIRKAIGL